jgi:hypothetical protein
MWSGKPSEKDLADLARWIYPLISYRIRQELREGLEKRGLITGSYGRW